MRLAAGYEKDKPNRAVGIYRRIQVREPHNIAAHNGLERLGAPGCYGERMRINCVIDERDDIFRFSARGEIVDPFMHYLADGWRTLAELMAVLERSDYNLARCESMLEFACGYGRFTRHLARLLPGRVTCSDVLPGSVEFNRAQFGVAGFYSDTDPQSIDFRGSYDLVFVLSLFTHLQVSRWGNWLRALGGAVRPGGLLVLTTHNEAFAGEQGIRFDHDGEHFIPSSESPGLDAGDYGTTYTTEAVVRREIRAALGQEVDMQLHRRAFWTGQDGVVLRLPNGRAH